MVAKSIRGVVYTFRYTGHGTVDFLNPVKGPAAKIIRDVNICDPEERRSHLRQQASAQAALRRQLRPLQSGESARQARQRATSPNGYTWHHHPDKGRMQLIDRQVHAEFKHVGGKAIWGTV